MSYKRLKEIGEIFIPFYFMKYAKKYAKNHAKDNAELDKKSIRNFIFTMGVFPFILVSGGWALVDYYFPEKKPIAHEELLTQIDVNTDGRHSLKEISDFCDEVGIDSSKIYNTGSSRKDFGQDSLFLEIIRQAEPIKLNEFLQSTEEEN